MRSNSTIRLWVRTPKLSAASVTGVPAGTPSPSAKPARPDPVQCPGGFPDAAYSGDHDLGTPAPDRELREPAPATIDITIDGQTVMVPEGTSVMRAAALAGVDVPKLCATDSLEAFGKHLAAHGLKYSDGPTPTSSGSIIAFVDAPEGYEIELIQKK